MMNRSKWRSGAAGLVSFSILASVVALATQADGREATRAESNDGGAWLSDRPEGQVGHVEASTQQSTANAAITTGGSQLSTTQAPGVVAVHDRTASTVTLVDVANAAQAAVFAIPSGAIVRTAPQHVIVFDPTTSRLWEIGANEAGGLANLDDTSTLPTGGGEGRLIVGRSGTLAVVGQDSVVWPTSDPTGDPKVVELPRGFEPAHLTMAGEQLVLVDEDEWLVATPAGIARVELSDSVGLVRLQREASSWPIVAAVDGAGGAIFVDLSNGEVIALGAPDGGGGTPITNPIHHEGCVHTLNGPADAAVFLTICQSGRIVLEADKAIPPGVELRLVNGHVWIDALDGSGYVLSQELELQEIVDFSRAFDESDGEESADGENVEDRLNQGAEDAALTEADGLDDDLENDPPIAEDDQAATRVTRPIVVDVLANDSDPDGDVILITDARIVAGETFGDIAVTTSRTGIQVTPSEIGTMTIEYSISDGRDGVSSAVVELDILVYGPEGNRPPELLLDRGVGTAGSTVSANLLVNDVDPDGDSLLLTALVAPEGVTVRQAHPDGEVRVVLPADLQGGALELTYTVEDEWQAVEEGIFRIEARLDGSNTPPDARNDAASTQVGRRVTIDLLANDVDAENDVLRIGASARPLDPNVTDFIQTLEDGEFSFEPTSPGTFLFDYAASDEQESDRAIIRVEVTDPEENGPPVAVRDDATLAVGDTRLVRVLANDGDPDGDLFDVIGWNENPSLKVVPEPGVGFRITMQPGARPVEDFTYQVSDGIQSSNAAAVILVRSNDPIENAPPVVIGESLRVRAGRTAALQVLFNDYDPEGGRIFLDGVTSDVDVSASVGSRQQTIEVTVPEGTSAPFVLQYVVIDEDGGTSTGTARVSIVSDTEPNRAPIARPDTAFTLVDQPVVVEVLVNDSDPESDALRVSAISRPPANGTAVEAGDGTGITYQPRPGFTGTDQFSYTVVDSEGESSTTTVSIGVMPVQQVNRAPVADDDFFTAGAGEGTITLDVLENDSDPDGDVIVVVEAVSELVSFSPDGFTLNFDVPASVTEETTVSFEYTISDEEALTDSAIVSVTVLPGETEEPPVASPDTVGPFSGLTSESISTAALLANDIDPDGAEESLRVVAVTAPATLSGSTIALDLNQDSFTFEYTVEDEDGLTDTSTVSVEVVENLPPVVTTLVLPEQNNDVPIGVIDLTDQAFDPEGDELTFQSISGAVGGTAVPVLEAVDARQVNFTPSSDFVGEASFSYLVSDGKNDPVQGRVTVQLLGPSNQPPEAINGQIVTVEAGLSLPYSVENLFFDPDVDDELTFAVIEGPGDEVDAVLTGGTLQVTSPVTLGDTQTAITIEATDPDGESIESTLTINITPTSVGPPRTIADEDETIQGEPVSRDVAANDLDTLGQGGLIVTTASAAPGNAGTASIGPDERTVTFTPGPDFFGPVAITYTVQDPRAGDGGSAQGIYTVTVVGRPDAPFGVAFTQQTSRSASLTWSAPNGNGDAISDYLVQLDNQSPISVGSAPGYLLTGLTPGTEHLIRVRAVNKAGQSEWSSDLAVVVDVIPGAPTTPTVVFGDGQMTVSWADGVNDGSPISGYEVQIGVCGSATRPVQGQQTLVWTGLTNGDECTFRVRAENLQGFSEWGPTSALECAVGVPLAPAAPVAVRGDNEATATWGLPTNPDCQPIVGYELERVLNGGVDGTTAVPFGTNTEVSAPLSNGEQYSFRVRAENRQGWGEWSSNSNVVVPCGVPLAPSAPTATPGDRQATVVRVGEADANGCAVQSYEINYSGSWVAYPADNIVRSLDNGQTYTFQVRGVNEIGEGDPSLASAGVIPFGPPFAPPSVSLAVSGNVRQWVIGVADDNGDPITSYGGTGNIGSFNGSVTAPTFGCQFNGSECLDFGSRAVAAPPTGCIQQAGNVSGSFYGVNQAGNGATRPSGTLTLDGCPPQPGRPAASMNSSGILTVSWTTPATTSQMWVQYGNERVSRNGTSTTIDVGNAQSVVVSVWACNRLGCVQSGTTTANRPTPSVSASWGPLSANQDGCNSSLCRTINFSWQNFQPNRSVRLVCQNSAGWGFNFTVNTGANGSGSDNTVGQCWIQPGFQAPIWVELDGVRSNDLPTSPPG